MDSSLLEAASALKALIDADMQRIRDMHHVIEASMEKLEEERAVVATQVAHAEERIRVASEAQQAIDSETEQIQKERHELEEMRHSILREQATLTEAKERMEALDKTEDDLVNVNAGGATFQVYRSTLCQVSDSALATMFSGRWDGGLKRDDHGSFLLDVSPGVFEAVLSYLRAKAFNPGAKLPKVSDALEEEMSAFMAFMTLTPPESTPTEFDLASITGHFCGGKLDNSCAPRVQYDIAWMDQILRGKVSADAREDKQAIYTHPHVGEHSLAVRWPSSCRLRGCKLRFARESSCRVTVIERESSDVLFRKDLFPGAYQRSPSREAGEEIFAFGTEVVTVGIRIVIDKCSDNVGFAALAFF